MHHPNAESLRSAVRSLNTGDLDGYLAAFDRSCPRWIAGVSEPLSLADVSSNTAALVQALEGFRLEELLLFGDGRYVCARWLTVGRHTGSYLGVPPTGRSVSFESAEIYEFEREDGGLVRGTWTYADPMVLLRQLGVSGG